MYLDVVFGAHVSTSDVTRQRIHTSRHKTPAAYLERRQGNCYYGHDVQRSRPAKLTITYS
jgi:hypothetical protein